MLPWVHVHQTPDNSIGGCCVSADQGVPVEAHTVEDLINHDTLKNKRRDMLTEQFNPLCSTCHEHEKIMGHSTRTDANELWAHRFDDSVPLTAEDGYLRDFKMSYFDIRFRNTCNMKCRSCGPGYSSLWQAEAIKYPIMVEYGDESQIKYESEPGLLDNLLATQAHNFERLWFAGGEPLVHDEHYAILKHLIDIGQTDVVITYSTNLSKLNFRDNDLFDLWKQFKQVDIFASIDSYGERAEIIRKGTNWSEILNNLKRVQKFAQENHHVVMHFNCVVSAMNYLTIPELMDVLISEEVLVPSNDKFKQSRFCFYPLADPDWLSARNLPADLKRLGHTKLTDYVAEFNSQGYNWVDFDFASEVETLIQYVDSQGQVNPDFFVYTGIFDEVRSEHTQAVFPELKPLFDLRIPQVNL